MGRPPLDDGERRDSELRIRLTAEEREAIDGAAAKALAGSSSNRGLSSTWARGVLLKAAARLRNK